MYIIDNTEATFSNGCESGNGKEEIAAGAS